MIRKLFQNLNVLFGNTLYFPGCLTKYVLKDIKQNYLNILDYCKQQYLTLDNEFCCGSPVINAGYYEDFEVLAFKNIELFKKYGIGKIIFNCPSCYYSFSKLYGEKLNVKTEHMSTFLLRLLRTKKIKLKRIEFTAAYHDPCHLGRSCGIYDEPRELLKMLGIKLVDLERNRSDSRCCGAGGGLKNYDADLSERIALNTLNELKERNISFLVTVCPMCYFQFKTVAIKHKHSIKVLELSQIIMKLLKTEDAQANLKNKIYEREEKKTRMQTNELDDKNQSDSFKIYDC